MDTVLGVSITPIAAGLVLLEGRTPDGVTVDRDAIDLTGTHASLTDVMAAVLGIQGSVSAQGNRLAAVGVTWSAGSEPKARELVTSLTEFGLANIQTIRPAEATSSLAYTSQDADGDVITPDVDSGEENVAVADGEVPLARGAALALARQTTAEIKDGDKPRRARRWRDPSSIAVATALCGGTLGVVAATWIGMAPRHADGGPPPPQQPSAPPALQVPPSAGATTTPVDPGRPLALTDSPQGATTGNTPTPTAPATTHQLVQVGGQHLRHPAGSSLAPPPDGQASAADDAPGPPQQPPAADPLAPPSPDPAAPAGQPPSPAADGAPPNGPAPTDGAPPNGAPAPADGAPPNGGPAPAGQAPANGGPAPTNAGPASDGQGPPPADGTTH